MGGLAYNNKESKYLKMNPVLPSKSSWKSSKKEEHDFII